MALMRISRDLYRFVSVCTSLFCYRVIVKDFRFYTDLVKRQIPIEKSDCLEKRNPVAFFEMRVGYEKTERECSLPHWLSPLKYLIGVGVRVGYKKKE
jgi:hypothetical protein